MIVSRDYQSRFRRAINAGVAVSTTADIKENVIFDRGLRPRTDNASSRMLSQVLFKTLSPELSEILIPWRMLTKTLLRNVIPLELPSILSIDATSLSVFSEVEATRSDFADYDAVCGPQV